MTKITAYPVGNGDTLRLDLRDGRKVLVDYADMRNKANRTDKRIDLPAALRADLRLAGRDYHDVTVFTHLDKDHNVGAGEFFEFDHARKYQGGDRIKMPTMWVPASALTDVGTEGCARLIREEAKHRMREGYGIRVFSRPDALKGWFEREKLDMASRMKFITNAGELVPGFGKFDGGGVEFFIHSPFGFRRNAQEVDDRNLNSLVFQATFREGLTDIRALFAADMPWQGLDDIVSITRNAAHRNDERLFWDFAKLPHHSSYLSLSEDKGVDRTVPTDNIKWLYEEAGQDGGILLSSSWPIPSKGTEEDNSVQPPHRQAASYYRNIATGLGGRYEVTMERPASNPRPTVVEITPLGARLVSNALAPTAAIAATPMRAG